MSKVGRITAFAAEASLWLAGAAIIAGAAGAHWDMPSVDLSGLIPQSSPGASTSPGASRSLVAASPAPTMATPAPTK